MKFAENKMIIYGAALAALALFVLVKKKGIGTVAADAGAALGGAAVDAAGGVVAGVTYGISDAIGIPRTDMTKCQAAIAAGHMGDASAYCPASVFATSGAFNPTSDKNIAYSGVNGLGAWISGDQNFDLGSKIYDWTH